MSAGQAGQNVAENFDNAKGAELLWLEQLVGRDAKSNGQAFKVVQRNVPDLPLHMGHEGPVQSGLQGERLLRPAPFRP